MSNKYIKVPKTISFQSIASKDYSLSSSQYMNLIMPNQNVLFVRDFLSRDLNRKDLGSEVGSLNYIGQSTHYFIRTKALQSHTFLPEINSETTSPIMPSAYQKMNLKAGDLLISKDSNIGEIVILDKDYPNYMLSGAIYKLPVKQLKYYLLAFIKHDIFREQLDFMVPMGATIRHAKTLFLDCKIPMPNQNAENTIQFIELLTQAIINKEKLIRQRHEAILKAIETELLENQKDEEFIFELPKIKEIAEVGRLDTNLFSKNFKEKEFLFRNYNKGFQTLKQNGFDLIRGNNLAISVIGTSIYLNYDFEGFYNLILPKNIDKYGTLIKKEYLGNPSKLIKLKQSDIVFGAEGFEKGRSIVIFNDSKRNITNFHGMTIRHKGNNLRESIFLKCFLDYLRNIGLIDLYATGGNGGSLSQKYWDVIPFPNFPATKQAEIAKLYHNAEIMYEAKGFDLESFLEKDAAYNTAAGIYELDKTAKQLKTILNEAIDNIVNDKAVAIRFE